MFIPFAFLRIQNTSKQFTDNKKSQNYFEYNRMCHLQMLLLYSGRSCRTIWIFSPGDHWGQANVFIISCTHSISSTTPDQESTAIFPIQLRGKQRGRKDDIAAVKKTRFLPCQINQRGSKSRMSPYSLPFNATTVPNTIENVPFFLAQRQSLTPLICFLIAPLILFHRRLL